MSAPLADQAILKLFEALDSYIELPERPKDRPFLMSIEGVQSISGRGTVVTGLIERLGPVLEPRSIHVDEPSPRVGTVTWKTAPRGMFAVTANFPPCASTIERQIDRPMPRPSGFVV
jgi:hypothetical protein